MKNYPHALPPDYENDGHSMRAVWRWRDGAFTATEDDLLDEIPVSLEWNGQHAIVMMATPMELTAFAIGFSLSEGIIDRYSDISALNIQTGTHGIAVQMEISAEQLRRITARKRARAGTGSCNLCGLQDMKAALRLPAPIRSEQTFSAQAITRAVVQLPAHQALAQRTGSAHCAAFANVDGEIILAAEDAGRHCALDKLIGKLAQAGIVTATGFIVVSSRASFEMVQKTAFCGAPLLCAVSAATALAAQLATTCGLSLLGFSRGQQFVCYAHRQRIVP